MARQAYAKRSTAAGKLSAASEATSLFAGKDSKFLTLARARFKQAQDATNNQRQRELEDLRFYAGDQWPEAIKALRMGSPGNAAAGQPATPARPCITINKTREPVKQVLNQERQSDLGAEIVPADDFGDLSEIDDTEIELREGLLRRIQRAPETSDAITWMFARAVICGTGYMGVMTRYLRGQTFDQEPYVCRFYNQSAVSLDPAHEQPDGSDAEWGFVGTDLSWEAYQAEFPQVGDDENVICGTSDDEFRALGDEAPGWFTHEGDVRRCRVVDYYYTDRTRRELARLADGSAVWVDELPESIPAEAITDRRWVIEKAIKWAKIDGCQVLDRTDWPGPDLPLIKCVGEELQPYDEERRIEGMVRPAIESNRGENYMISKMVETIGLAPIPPLMMANGQDEGFEAEYASMNTRTLGVLHYNMKDAEGNLVGPPTRPPVETPIGPMVTAVQFFNESIHATMGQPSPTLGEVDPSIKSARGLKTLLNQAQLGNSNYMDNLARSVRRMAVILNGLFYPLYGHGDRLARIVNGEGEPETVLINPRVPVQPAGKAQPKPLTLTEHAHFNVAIKVTKNYDTRREAESSMLGELIGSNPEFMAWFGDLFLKNTDIPDHKQLAERAKLMLAPPIQQMLQAKEQGQAPIPPEVQQKLAKAEEVIKWLSEANQQLLKDAELEAAKQQAETQRAQLEAESSRQIESLKAQAALMKQQMSDAFKAEMEQFKAEQAMRLQNDQQAHELALAAAGAAASEHSAERAERHAANMGRQAHESAEIAGERGHERQIEMMDREPDEDDGG